ncbi:arylsulfatase, partial [Verrucomicrobia bacterium]|nr:arylsulfatase [Verrucomicrobiota bacterium]
MSSRVLLLVLLFALSAQAADRPNILFIYTDDQGYGDASCLNPEAKFKTPNIDRLASEGMIFTDGHSSDTVCTPSRYGLLTGRYSWRTTLKRGVFGAEKPCLIADGRTTVPSLLRDNGYDTAMVGKWHLGMDFPNIWGDRDWSKPTIDMPLDKGFDYFWGIPASMNYGVLAWFDGRHAAVPPTLYTRKKKNKMAFSDYRIMPPYEAEPEGKKDLEVAPDFIDTDCLQRFTDKSIEYIGNHAKSARDGKPFFLYLPLTSPHKPVVPIDQFQGKSQAGAYGDFMVETDWHIGRVLKALDKAGLTKNTLVFFSSDNGAETTWKQRLGAYKHSSSGIYKEGKRSIYEGGHRVPFIMRWPAGIKAGSIWNGHVCQTDMLATVADIVGASLPANAGEDSNSLLPMMKSPNDTHAHVPLIHHASSGRFAVRQGDWKLIMEQKKFKRELYNLSDDPSETKNVIADHPAIEQRLKLKITRIITGGRSTTGAPAK